MLKNQSSYSTSLSLSLGMSGAIKGMKNPIAANNLSKKRIP
jgi:hypothetical protein